MMLTRDDAKRIIEKVLSYSKADACQVNVVEEDSANTRFANNAITTAGAVRAIRIDISSTKGTQTGTMRTNETSDAALRDAVAQSEEMAGFATPDPEYVPPLEPQKYPEIKSYDAATAGAAQPEMIPGVHAAISGSEEKKLNSAGFFERDATAVALGNNRGNFGYNTRTTVNYSLTARTPDGTGSGWASATANRIADIDAPAVARVAIDKAVLSQKPRSIEPGLYPVVLEPAAVRDFMQPMLGFGSAFDARAAEEGRSLMTKKGGGTRLGEKAFSEKITIASDPFDTRNPGTLWAFSGAQGHLGGEGRGQEPDLLTLLGAEETGGADSEYRQRADDPRRGPHHRRSDQVGRARAAHHPLLVHPFPQSTDGAAHRPDSRWRVHDRERQDRLSGDELPLEREPRELFEQGRDDVARGARRQLPGTGDEAERIPGE
jgi:hypothetical protein